MKSPLGQFSQHGKHYTNALAKVQMVCRDLLKNHPLAKEARDYLNNRVSIENQELFNFGYFPDDDNLHILLEKFPEATLQNLGLIYPYHVQNGDTRAYKNKGILCDHNITTPYYDWYGNIVAFVGRTILSEDDRKSKNIQKYKYLKGPYLDASLQFKKINHLFGLYQAKNAIIEKDSVVIVEGQIDCITCHEYGIHNVVGLGGSSLHNIQFSKLLFFAKHIYLLLDSDIEGMKAQDKIFNKYSSHIKIDKISLPDGFKDVDEFLRTKPEDISTLFRIA